MNTLLLWRLVKWIGVGLFFSGVLGALWPESLRDRRRAAYSLATPGFFLAWLAGWALARATGVSLGSTWLSVGMLASLVSLQAVVWGVETAERPRALVGAVALGGLLVATGVMVWRPGTRAAPGHASAAAPAAELAAVEAPWTR